MSDNGDDDDFLDMIASVFSYVILGLFFVVCLGIIIGSILDPTAWSR